MPGYTEADTGRWGRRLACSRRGLSLVQLWSRVVGVIMYVLWVCLLFWYICNTPSMPEYMACHVCPLPPSDVLRAKLAVGT